MKMARPVYDRDTCTNRSLFAFFFFILEMKIFFQTKLRVRTVEHAVTELGGVRVRSIVEVDERASYSKRSWNFEYFFFTDTL